MERIRTFLWKVGHIAILTNVKRYRRRTAQSPCFHNCIIGVETILHALRDYLIATKIWEQVVIIEDQQVFFTASLYTWLVDNLASRKSDSYGGDWVVTFRVCKVMGMVVVKVTQER